MPRLYVMDETSASHNYFNSLDMFIFCSGTSIRFYSNIDILLSSSIDIGSIQVIDYSCRHPDEEPEKSDYDVYKKYDANILSVENNILQQLKTCEFGSCKSIGIDITGLAIPDLFQMQYYLNIKYPDLNLIYFYSEPEHYRFRNGVFDEYSPHGSERDIRMIPGYINSGEGNEEVLVLFIGFEEGISRYVQEQVEPKDTVIIYGSPSYLPKLKDICLLNNLDLVSQVHRTKKIGVKATNPFEAYNALEEIKAAFPSHLISICSLGTHPMALGASLFALDNPRTTKVIYPYPKTNSVETTQGVSASWVYIPNFFK